MRGYIAVGHNIQTTGAGGTRWRIQPAIFGRQTVSKLIERYVLVGFLKYVLKRIGECCLCVVIDLESDFHHSHSSVVVVVVVVVVLVLMSGHYSFPRYDSLDRHNLGGVLRVVMIVVLD